MGVGSTYVTACLWTKKSKSLKIVKVIQNYTDVSFYQLSIVGLNMCLPCSPAVNDIFNVKYWRNLEILVRGRSRSLKMAPIDGS